MSCSWIPSWGRVTARLAPSRWAMVVSTMAKRGDVSTQGRHLHVCAAMAGERTALLYLGLVTPGADVSPVCCLWPYPIRCTVPLGTHLHARPGCMQVLLSKSVMEEKILFLSIIASPEGITRVCSAFPKLKVGWIARWSARSLSARNAGTGAGVCSCY